jgi:hypothetical protein
MLNHRILAGSKSNVTFYFAPFQANLNLNRAESDALFVLQHLHGNGSLPGYEPYSIYHFEEPGL